MIHHVSLNDCLEGTAPPEKLLTVGVVDDTAFVYINTVKHNGDTETQTVTAQIAVSLPSLREALALLSNDRIREDLRPADSDTSRAARLEGPRAVVVNTA